MPSCFTGGEGHPCPIEQAAGWVDPRIGLDALEKRKISWPC